jgi:hypothetical protein
VKGFGKTDDKDSERLKRQEDMDAGLDQLKHLTASSFFPPDSAEKAFDVAQHFAAGKQPQMWSVVQRVKALDREHRSDKSPLTLFLAHANGFHKEIWEPALQHLIERYERGQRREIAEVWMLDTFNSGESAILNAAHLSVGHTWFDHTRDMQQFLQFYLPELGAKVPTLLQRRDGDANDASSAVVAIGHSHSAACLMMLPRSIRDTLTGLLLIEPTATPFQDLLSHLLPFDVPLVMGALARRDTFASRTHVTDYMSTRKYFSAWDDKVRELHVRFGFKALSGVARASHEEQPVTLRMSKWSEAYTFASQLQGSWCMSDDGDHATGPKTHFIFSQSHNEHLPMLSAARKYVQQRENNRYTMEEVDAGHLLVMEDPQRTGGLLADAMIRQQTDDLLSNTQAKL